MGKAAIDNTCEYDDNAADETQVAAREERVGIFQGPFHTWVRLVSDVSEDMEAEKDARESAISSQKSRASCGVKARNR